MSAYRYRVKYWVWVNPNHGEWRNTGLMQKEHAELVAANLRYTHEKVEVYEDDNE